MEMNYIVEAYCGGTYCGNAFCETMEECINFANDGICDKAIIVDLNTRKKTTVKF